MLQTHQLAVDEIHTLYIEERGNRDGIPILFLHGGPGTGISASSASYFDHAHYRVILFDQRGAGKSTPFACLENNTTAHLVDDIEKIRHLLNIDRWIVFGGSWGATLAVVYAQAHPSSVLAMIVRGILLGDGDDVHWLLKSGAPHIWTKEWEEFISIVPEQERSNLIEAYWKLVQHENKELAQRACRSWTLWEARNLTLMADMAAFEDFFNNERAVSIARLELHYFRHGLFLQPGQILKNMHKLQEIPAKIIHGRYDTVCPFSNSWKLHQAWKNSQLIPVESAGHAGLDPGIHKALIQATEEFKLLNFQN